MTALFASTTRGMHASKYEICQKSYNIVLQTLIEPFYIVYEVLHS